MFITFFIKGVAERLIICSEQGAAKQVYLPHPTKETSRWGKEVERAGLAGIEL